MSVGPSMMVDNFHCVAQDSTLQSLLMNAEWKAPKVMPMLRWMIENSVMIFVIKYLATLMPAMAMTMMEQPKSVMWMMLEKVKNLKLMQPKQCSNDEDQCSTLEV